MIKKDDVSLMRKLHRETDFSSKKSEASSRKMMSLKTICVFAEIIIIIIIGIYIAPFPFIKCSKALHIVIV